MRDEELLRIVDDIGWEQVLFDAELTIEDVMLLLHELKYVDLDIYDMGEQ